MTQNDVISGHTNLTIRFQRHDTWCKIWGHDTESRTVNTWCRMQTSECKHNPEL